MTLIEEPGASVKCQSVSCLLSSEVWAKTFLGDVGKSAVNI